VRIATDARPVLVVDDDEDCRQLLSASLARTGLRVRDMATGVEALHVARHERVALAVVEVCLGDVSGYEVCHELKEGLGYTLPVILVSGQRVEPLDRVAGLLIGADDYLVKPVDPDELLVRARKLIIRATPAEPALNSLLTPRELEILCLLADGLEQREISDQLHISSKTVATHIERILGKVGARSRAQAIAIAYQTGLMDDRLPARDPRRAAEGDRGPVLRLAEGSSTGSASSSELDGGNRPASGA
jgi:two-component system nitrate/nitrite response regulator NarL